MASQKKRRRKKSGASRAILAFILLGACVAATIIYLTKSTSGAAVEADVEISEVMTSNKGTVPDENGDFPDWVEIHNKSDHAVDIGGYGLGDDIASAAKWTFPAGTSIAANGYLVVFCSGSEEGNLHAPFKLSASDAVVLTTVNGKVIDSIQLKAVASGATLAKDEAGQWAESKPSPGYPNTEEGAATFISTLTAAANESIGVYINEFMASNASTLVGPDGSYCDWIELYNTTGQDIDLSGCGVSDDEAQPLKFVIPDGVTIKGYSTLLIYCTGRTTNSTTELEAPFGLAAYQESVVFSNKSGKILDSYSYNRMETDTSMARVPDGTGDFVVTNQPTPGYANNQSGVMAFQATQNYGKGAIILSEAMNANVKSYADENGQYYDWIEVYNQSGQAVNLAGYALSTNAKNPAKWVFPDVSIGPGEYKVVLASGRNVTDTQKKNLETNFGLSASGCSLFLFSPEAELIDKLQMGAGHADVSYGRTGSQLMYYTTATPGSANTNGASGYAEIPTIELAAGVYTSAQSVSITVPDNCVVRYTLDGSEPTQNSQQYGGPITVGKNTVLRARAFSTLSLYQSDIATASYFVVTGENTPQNHATNLTIVSVVTDPKNLWDPEIGIYVVGSAFAAASGQAATDTVMTAGMNDPNWNLTNFCAQPRSHPDPLGRNWERSAHFDVIDETGAFEYGSDSIVRIFGDYSRNQQQKGLALIARAGYGPNMFHHQFFDNRDYSDYKSVILRASAMDSTYSRIRDILITGLVDDADLGIAVQAYRQVIVYLNGQYWGVYNLREKLTRYFIASYFGLNNPDAIQMLKGNATNEYGIVYDPTSKGLNDYIALINYCKNNDLSNANNYEYVKSLVDVDNFATYCAAEILVGNTDTGNIKFWRSSETDNKWRWILFDFDWAMNRNDDNSDAYSSGYRRDFFSKYLHVEGHGNAKTYSTVLSRGLLQNQEFKQLFLQKCALMFNEVFTTDKILAKVDELQNNIYNEMQFDVTLWSGIGAKSWGQHCDNIRAYAKNYPDYYLKYVQNYFSLSDSEMISLFGRVTTLAATTEG